jgi:hypothetical protein
VSSAQQRASWTVDCGHAAQRLRCQRVPRDNAFLATQGHSLKASLEEVAGVFQHPQPDARQYSIIA